MSATVLATMIRQLRFRACAISTIRTITTRITSRRWNSTTSTSSTKWTQQLVPAFDGFELNVSLYNATSTEGNKATVLCFPGALGTGPSDFEALLQGGLGSDITVVAMDPRGLTERTFPLNFYQRDAMDGAAVMAHLNIPNYSVLGWSDGANAAIHLAASAAHNKEVDKLVVFGGNAYVTQEDVDAWEHLRNVQNWSERMRNDKASVHGGVEQLQEINNAATDAWIRLYTEKAGDVCLAALHQVACPTLVLHGAKDVICSMQHAKYIAKQIADSTLVVFPEGKHNLHQRHADVFHDIVRDFLLDNTDTDQTGDQTGDQTDQEPSPTTTTTIPTTEQQKQNEPAIDQIAYAFMGSKALSTALNAGVFDAIDKETTPSQQGVTFEQIQQHADIKGERLQTLLSACVSLDLIHRTMAPGNIDLFTLPKASQEQLVQTSKHYWGDYIANQVDAQFYTKMNHLDTVMKTGDTASDGYETWFDADPEAARKYTQAQHNGSLATAYALHRKLLKDDVLQLLTKQNQPQHLRLLDVGGGSGAFSIVTARKIPHAKCTVLDLPNVISVAKDIIAQEDEEVQTRIQTVALSANDPGKWHDIEGLEDDSYEIVLMSYINGSIPVPALQGLYQNAFRVLKPGGIAILHDFFVDNDGGGPRNAALWALAHCTVNPDGMGLRPNRIVKLLAGAGFVAPKIGSLIPETTQTIVATKPSPPQQ